MANAGLIVKRYCPPLTPDAMLFPHPRALPPSENGEDKQQFECWVFDHVAPLSICRPSRLLSHLHTVSMEESLMTYLGIME